MTVVNSANTENETEVSFFNRAAYETFKQHPEVSFLAKLLHSD